MTDAEIKRAYDTVTMSMREHVVPMSTVWADQIKQLESCPWFDFELSSTFKQEAKEFYTTPYSYNNPVWVRYLDIIRAGRFTDKEMCRVAATIKKERIHPHYDNAIPDEYVAYLDNNYDIGVIIYAKSGYIVPFEYHHVDGFEFAAIPAEIPLQLKMKQENVKPGDTAYEIYMRELDERKEKFGLEYTIKYKTDRGDKFFSPGDRFIAFQHTPYVTSSDVVTTIEYMQLMFEAHAKCIVLA